MPRLAPSPALHSDTDVLTVAKGLAVVAGTDVAAEQLRRIYGERRAAEALLRAAGGRMPQRTTTRAGHRIIDVTDARLGATTGAIRQPVASCRRT